MRGAGGAQAGVEGVGVLAIGDRRIEIRPAAEPAPRGGQEAAIHVHCRDVRIGHVRDQADAGGEKARIDVRAGNRGGEFWAEFAVDGRDVDPDLVEDLAIHLAAHPAAAMRSVSFGAVPRDVLKRRLAPGLAFDRLERGANPGAQRFEPVARGLLLIVEGIHRGNSPV